MQFPSDDSSNNYTRRTEVLQGTQNVIDTELQFFSKAQTKVLVKETLQDLIKQLHQIVELMQKPFTINILIDIIEHRDAYNELKNSCSNLKKIKNKKWIYLVKTG